MDLTSVEGLREARGHSLELPQGDGAFGWDSYNKSVVLGALELAVIKAPE